MDVTEFEVTGEVELFPGQGGWHHVAVPEGVSAELEPFADRGLVPITARVGETTWDTSLLPKGDGTHFIALKARVRRREDIELGDPVVVRFRRRSP